MKNLILLKRRDWQPCVMGSFIRAGGRPSLKQHILTRSPCFVDRSTGAAEYSEKKSRQKTTKKRQTQKKKKMKKNYV